VEAVILVLIAAIYALWLLAVAIMSLTSSLTTPSYHY